MKAMISTSDRTGIVALAKTLVDAGFELVSTGGTGAALREGGLAVTQVADLTGSPADRTESARPMFGASADSSGSSCAPVITVCLDPATDTPYRRYGLTQLLRVMRLSPIWTAEHAPAIYYGADSGIGRQAAIWIRPQRADSQVGPGRGVFPIDGVPPVTGLLLRLEFDSLLGRLRLGVGGPDDLCGFPVRTADAVARDHPEQHPAEQEPAGEGRERREGSLEWRYFYF